MIYIIVGLLVGMLVFAGIWWWSTRPQAAESRAGYDSRTPIITGSPIEYKLRNSIYETEREVLACEDEIEDLCKYQLELLRGLGKPTFLYESGRELYFKFENPLRKEERYYYESELDDDMEEEEIEKRREMLKNYSVHIKLYQKKWEFFKFLLSEYKENLAKLERTEEGKMQMTAMRKSAMQQQQQMQTQQQIGREAAAAKSGDLLASINKNMEETEAYWAQYKALDAKYNNQQDISAYQIYQEKLDDILDEIEEERPKNQKK